MILGMLYSSIGKKFVEMLFIWFVLSDYFLIFWGEVCGVHFFDNLFTLFDNFLLEKRGYSKKIYSEKVKLIKFLRV